MKKTGTATRGTACGTRAPGQGRESFTLIELLTVMAVILILAGIVLSGAGYLQNKGAQSRAQAEIQSLENACESYKADNGVYPVATGTTDILYAKQNGNPNATGVTVAPGSYQPTSFYLYVALTGDTNGYGLATLNYFPIKPTMCARANLSAPISSTNPVLYLADPWGNSYGYSTAGQSGTNGYNPTFDLWSTGGNTATPNPGVAGDVTVMWIKNW